LPHRRSPHSLFTVGTGIDNSMPLDATAISPQLIPDRKHVSSAKLRRQTSLTLARLAAHGGWRNAIFCVMGASEGSLFKQAWEE
jgi:hypothetical protein